MLDTQIMSPTWRHSVKCQMHRSRVQRGVILYNVRYTDHKSIIILYNVRCRSRVQVYLTYRMTPCRTRDLCIWHNTEWRHVGLVICVSDIIQNDDGLVICVSAIIQNDNMLDSWSVYLTFYRMTPCWTHDLCIWHFTEWRHVGLVISCCHSV